MSMFQFDQQGKCLNPEIYFNNESKFPLKFGNNHFYRVSICCKNEFWACKVEYPNCKKPFVGANYLTEEDAIQAAHTWIKRVGKQLRLLVPSNYRQKIIVLATLDVLQFIHKQENENTEQKSLF